MIVRLNLRKGTCRVIRQKGDKHYSANFHDESRFFYDVKRELIKQGYDVIKKRADKENMVGDTYWVRSRNTDRPDSFGLWDSGYAIDYIQEDLQKYGEADLTVVMLKED